MIHFIKCLSTHFKVYEINKLSVTALKISQKKNKWRRRTLRYRINMTEISVFLRRCRNNFSDCVTQMEKM